MDIQYWIKYAALAVAIGQSIIVGDALLRRFGWYFAMHPLPDVGENPPKPPSLELWIGSIAWALYFAL